MTDNDPADGDEAPQPDPPKGQDALLGLFARLGYDGAPFPVSVLTHGLWISGTILTPSAYLRHLADSFRTDGEDNALVRRFAEWADEITPLDPDSPDPQVIHLTDVRVLGPNTATPIRMPAPVRVRLGHVAAWTIGTFGDPT
jgi:hypothetical protein